MNLEKFVVLSGVSGVFKIVANRKDGLIVESLEDGKSTFAASRKHQFSSLDAIAIYTEDDSTPLKEVFNTMFLQIDTLARVTEKSSTADLTNYFAQILPIYDRDRVHLSDIKKIVKWFNFLYAKGQLVPSEKEDNSAVAEADKAE